ncbi:hypothetical protein GRI75_11485 [Altererythrobacter soli]|uniref:Uncharacterized protein n=1 Tax=Croceibacterium soli TaxID=1739690 RepID=A0A6I4UU02_9SPHN|nr:hypothetical protein [Croceibacterium soli]MXP42261.1 hypothetical protein [Croceibacterium soli]
MANPEANSGGRWLLILGALAILLLLLWQFGMFGTGQEQAEPTYEAGVTDAGGGDLIVGDSDAEGVPVDVPDTPMTNVPLGEESPGPSPTPE